MKDILFISTKNWHGETEVSCHHIVRELLKKGFRVIYVENYGTRAFDLQLFKRAFGIAINKVKNIFLNRRKVRNKKTPKNLVLIKPFFIPIHQSKIVTVINSFLITRKINTVLQKHGVKMPILWTRSPTDLTLSIVNNIKKDLFIYQSVDKFIESPNLDEKMKERYTQSEYTLIKEADLVFNSAYSLYLDNKVINENSYFYPNGVFAEYFQDVKEISSYNIPENNKKNICFIGNFGRWVDVHLIKYIAENMINKANILLIGPSQVNIEQLIELPNVHYYGHVEFKQLPFFLSKSDIGIIPYHINSFTKYTYPSKVMEYLAAGLNVVTTNLPELAYLDQYIHIANNEKEFLESVDDLVNGKGKSTYKARIDIAKKNDWHNIVNNMIDNISCISEAKHNMKKGE